jgi:hypothetical protein
LAGHVNQLDPAMAEVTYYVALPFVATDDGVAAGEPTECFNPNAAVADPASIPDEHMGVIPFDPKTKASQHHLETSRVTEVSCQQIPARGDQQI